MSVGPDHPWLSDWDYPWEKRVLTAKRTEDGWTVIDRDTGDLIGSFGLPVSAATKKEALDEAERFGSKWGWPTDREAVDE